MITRLAVACLAATAVTLRVPRSECAEVLRAQLSRPQRSRAAIAQFGAHGLPAGWTTGSDPASGAAYYYNEITGESQWEPPLASAQQGHGAQVCWLVLPKRGTLNQYAVRNGEEQILGRFDMAEQNPYISRMQCLVKVARDGTASLTSIGKPSTLCKMQNAARWRHLWKFEERALADGDEISLNFISPEGATYTIMCQQENVGMGGGGSMQYSDDGQWIWNGSEWIPAPH